MPEADNCCSPLHENCDLRAVFKGSDHRGGDPFKEKRIFFRGGWDGWWPRLAGRGGGGHQWGMTGGEVRRVLEEAGVHPSRQMGQNFLCDPNLARAIVDALGVGAGDAVVEVGPGTGALTEHLVGRVRRLVLVEFDARLAGALERRYAGVAGVEVHHADGAQFDTRRLFRHRPIHLLGNLPYSAGGAIMENFLSSPSPLASAVLMLQKEVVGRVMARPRTKDYGLLTLRVARSWDAELLRVVPPEVFHPRPRVESAVMRLVPRRVPLPVHDARWFDRLLRMGFAQRRKQLHKQLPPVPPWGEVASALGVAPTARAEELSLEQWVELARIYDDHGAPKEGQSADEWFDVVDEDNQVTGRATRQEVHRLGLRHRAVHIFVFNRRGELFLQKRSRLKDHYPGAWDSSAAGHLDAGEDYHPAMVRELREELGIETHEAQEIGRVPACPETGWEHVRIFRVVHEGPVRFPCGEIEDGLWLAPEEIAAWIAARPDDFAPGFLACWEVCRGGSR